MSLEPLILFPQCCIFLVFLGNVIKLESVLFNSAEAARALPPGRSALLWAYELLINIVDHGLLLVLLLLITILLVDVVVLLLSDTVIVEKPILVSLVELFRCGHIFIIWIQGDLVFD